MQNEEKEQVKKAVSEQWVRDLIRRLWLRGYFVVFASRRGRGYSVVSLWLNSVSKKRATPPDGGFAAQKLSFYTRESSRRF